MKAQAITGYTCDLCNNKFDDQPVLLSSSDPLTGGFFLCHICGYGLELANDKLGEREVWFCIST